MAKRSLIDHPKFARLQMRLRLPRYAAVGMLETLWQMTGRYTPQGDIGKYDDEEIEAWIGWEGEPGELVAALVHCGFLDVHDEHRLVVHDWADHVDNTTKTALKRSNLEVVSTRCHNTVETESESVAAVLTPPEPEPEPEPEPGGAGGAKRKRFAAPTLEEARGYAQELGMPPDEGTAFVDYHTARGWLIARQPMRDWRAAMRTWRRTWERSNKASPPVRTSADLARAAGRSE